VGQGHLGTAIALFFPSDRILGNSWSAEINFNFNVSMNMSVELAAAWTKTDVAGLGDIQMIPLTVSAQYGDHFGDAGRWYAGLGLGWMVNNFDGGGISADDSLVVHIMGGVEVPVTDMIKLCVELRYQMANTDLSTPQTLDLDAFLFRVNVVWLF